MSFRDAPLFDLLSGAVSPFSGFGPLIPPELAIPRFEEVADQARERLADVFGIGITQGSEVLEAIEAVIASMWLEGWDPDQGDLDVFARDFGTLVATAILNTLGGKLTFRSETDLSHASLWWEDAKTAVFPYHKVAKRLLRRDGEDLRYFWRSLAKTVQREE